MYEISLAQARQITELALAGPRSDDVRRIAVVVVDAGGHPLCSQREEDAPPLLLHIAEAKAKTCIVYGKPTRAVMDWATETPVWFEGVSRVSQSRMGLPLIGTEGGVLIVDDRARRIGAVGVAGEQGNFDRSLAVLGIERAGLAAQFE